MSLTIPLDFVHQLNEADSLAATLDCIAEWLPQILPAVRASITFASNDKKALEIYTVKGNQAIPQFFSLPVDNTFVGWVYKNRQAQYYNTCEHLHYEDSQILHSHGVLSSLCVPLVYAKKVFGTINLGNDQSNSYQDTHLNLLVNLSKLLANYLYIYHELQVQQKLAVTDPLTDLPNRRAFYTEAENLMDTWLEQAEPFCILILDLDFFKQINDELGHEAGDKVLIAFAQVLMEQINPNTHCARIGGEEFAILYPTDSLNQVRQLADSICTQCELIKIPDLSSKLTVSIGGVKVCKDDLTIDQIMSRADIALYSAKVNGRNQACIMES